ncbi:FAD/FMN-containing dehydrogenase [Antricoccus suffuscus]|uniref:FAD/FMN-containing dehydrogenase n=1 Tax=Antricoccus suffuscus TaxID=1629062 RepID=A0A2T0ZXU8_9ACTN|nr:FAD-binding protein [Antricoccus suffuscus]PRZ41181.1 FAD/FMN-containing dehydrogenase [Antricoccus suffuscus]
MIIFPPGSPEYESATTPHNAIASQHPAVVARPTSTAEVAEVVAYAAARGLGILPQATGHGAGGEIGDDVLILDTSGLVELTIDPKARTASAGPGLTWGEINPRVEKFGLLGLLGSSPSVAIGGYTFGGGFGWLTRPHGAASAALRSVEYVDGTGRVRLASDDAVDAVDRDAVWAFRGGGGVGIATRLDFDLKPAPDLYAGYFLWPIDDLEAVTTAWAAAQALVGEAVGTSISVLHTPPGPPFPDDLQGVPVVHLAVASSHGEDEARPLLNAVREAAAPVVDTWGPADAAKLATIHLDPPAAVPALGDARWLSSETPDNAVGILAVASASHSPLALIEIRSFANNAATRDGAATITSGPFALHAVGALGDSSDRPVIEAAFKKLRAAAAPVDLGRSIGSWVEGASSVPDALAPEVRERVVRIADAVDPEGRIRRSRYLL